MLFPLIGARLHGWLDDLVVAIYVAGALLLPLRGPARAIALAGAAVHFSLTRLTAYPHGTFKWIPFRTHAFIELAEGVGVLAATACVFGATPRGASAFLIALGLSQLGAFSFSNYDPAS